MKADGVAGPALPAPCGICCTVCYRHLAKKPCAGCAADAGKKPGRRQSCAIRRCAGERGLSHCFLCREFPCRLIKNLDKSYRTRYGASLVKNGLAAKEMGVEAFLAAQLRRYTCGECGGVISMTGGICSECGKTVSPYGGGIKG